MLAGPLSDAVGWDQLSFGVDRNKGPLVAKAMPIIAGLQVHLLLANIGPDFVALNAMAIEVAHLVVGKCGAAGSDLHQQTHDRVAMRVGHSFGRTDRVTLDKGLLTSAVHFSSSLPCAVRNLACLRPASNILSVGDIFHIYTLLP